MQWFQADLQLNDSKWEQWSVLASHGTHCNLCVISVPEFAFLLIWERLKDCAHMGGTQTGRLLYQAVHELIHLSVKLPHQVCLQMLKKNSKNKKASLLYILEGSYEGLQKVLWSSTYHIQKISVIRPENPVSCDISSCHGHFVLTVAALKGDKWRSCLSKKLLRILNLIKHTKNKEIELLTQYIGGL